MPEEINLADYKIGANAQDDAKKRLDSLSTESREVVTNLAPRTTYPPDKEEKMTDGFFSWLRRKSKG